MGGISQTAEQWAGHRGVSRATLEWLGVVSGITSMPGIEGPCEVIAFPYRRGPVLVNTKYRALADKAFRQDLAGELRFWNLDAVLSGAGEDVYIVEGEMDLAALIEAGLPPDKVLSVPNGAPAQSAEDPGQQDRYRFVEAALGEGLGKVKKFILAGDNDPPGLALRHDLVRLFGAARSYFIEWPSGVKDAGDFLKAHGPENLRIFVEEDPRPWPVHGLYSLSEIPKPVPMELWDVGFPGWETKLRFAPSTVSVLTGHPGHGKTSYAMQQWFQICRQYGLSAAFASFETRAKPHHQRNIQQFMFQQPAAYLSEEQKAEADRWHEEHIYWIIHPNRRPSLGFILEMAEVAIHRHGARIVQIDPWNRLESSRPDSARETDWIGQNLDEMIDFARDFNIHLQVLAHPAKMANPKGDARSRRPSLEDIAGSKHWDNKVDQGLSIYRPKIFDGGIRQTACTLFHLKARHDELGYPCALELNYDLSTCSYNPVRTPLREAMAS